MTAATAQIANGLQMLDVKQVATLLGCSPRNVYRQADLGLMPYGRRIGGIRRWLLSEIQEWVTNGCPPVRRGV
jgi:predicted DNA-binding transcriptional regulator AlpA